MIDEMQEYELAGYVTLPKADFEEKLEKAIAFMGKKYCYHPNNHVKRLKTPLPYKNTDICKTFSKFM